VESENYTVGADPDIVQVTFEKVEALSNTRKFFHIDITTDMFESWSLRVTKGRMGARPRVINRGHDCKLGLIKDLTDLVRKRHEHGYTLVNAIITDELNPLFDELFGATENNRSNVETNMALFHCLKLLRNISYHSDDFSDFREAFNATIHSLDPQNKDSSKQHLNTKACQLAFPSMNEPEVPNYTHPRRRVIRYLVKHLLASEPLVAQSIYSALQVPGRFAGENIVNFQSFRYQQTNVRSIRLLTLLEREPRLNELGEKLFFSGIKTACQLMAMSESELMCDHNATREDIVMLRYVMGLYGLHLSADRSNTTSDQRQATAPVPQSSPPHFSARD